MFALCVQICTPDFDVVTVERVAPRKPRKVE